MRAKPRARQWNKCYDFVLVARQEATLTPCYAMHKLIPNHLTLLSISPVFEYSRGDWMSAKSHYEDVTAYSEGCYMHLAIQGSAFRRSNLGKTLNEMYHERRALLLPIIDFAIARGAVAVTSWQTTSHLCKSKQDGLMWLSRPSSPNCAASEPLDHASDIPDKVMTPGEVAEAMANRNRDR